MDTCKTMIELQPFFNPVYFELDSNVSEKVFKLGS